MIFFNFINIQKTSIVVGYIFHKELTEILVFYIYERNSYVKIDLV